MTTVTKLINYTFYRINTETFTNPIIKSKILLNMEQERKTISLKEKIKPITERINVGKIIAITTLAGIGAGVVLEFMKSGVSAHIIIPFHTYLPIIMK
jgi:hypothetical protein